jgi:hypothetical protein
VLIGEKMAPRLSSFINEAKRMATNAIKPLTEEKQNLIDAHLTAREDFDVKIKDRLDNEQRGQSSRTRKG